MGASANEVLRRSIVLPVDLYADVERVARADGYASVQAFVVCRLQAIVNARPETQLLDSRVKSA